MRRASRKGGRSQMEKRTADSKTSWWRWIGLLLSVFYLAFALLDGAHTYPDSESYMTMSFAREPMYPLFLGLLRLLFGRWGEGAWLRAAVVAQSLLAAWAAWAFARGCSKLFKLSRPGDLAVTLCAVLPSLMCRFAANRRMMYSCSILSEALAMPLFLVFFLCLLRLALEGGRRPAWEAALLSFVLISVRKQMLITLPLLVLTLLVRGWRERRFPARLAAALLLTAGVLLANTALDRGYNYVLRGEAVRHTGDTRFITTVLLYNARPGDGEHIEDEELRALYEQIIRKADENRYLGLYAPKDWFGRTDYFGSHYDHIQFLCLRDTAQAYARQKLGADEDAVSRELDRINDGLNAALLPVEKTRLLRTACDNFGEGLVTTVLAMKRILVPAAAALYLALLGLLLVCARKKRGRETVFALLCLAAIGANLALVSLTIFCQARYTIYNMPIFYTALFLLARGALQKTPLRAGEKG